MADKSKNHQKPRGYKELIRHLEAAGPSEEEYLLMSLVVLMGSALEEFARESFTKDAANYALKSANDYVIEVFDPDGMH